MLVRKPKLPMRIHSDWEADRGKRTLTWEPWKTVPSELMLRVNRGKPRPLRTQFPRL